ncbi:polyamine deacetylase HDAC10 isoform X2 [Antennarius striatus]|uniref:polyamine deacetylase HDAC10 isoform X2 n=1 Tax=Antennarius striatus TaxID=241820 RepID=UPI0035AF03FD
MKAGTALIYDEEMTRHRLLWDDPFCEIEVPERLTVSHGALVRSGLAARCVSIPVREAKDEDILLVHSQEYLEAVKTTPHLSVEELQEFSKPFGDVYFHPDSYHCAKLAAGAALQLVDGVLTGKVRNGLALVRPPGHHSMHSAANGFCVFNNVAIAARYAKKNYGVKRVLIVDWDIHHGQGVQYCFEDDPSVLYFSWHRYEHQRYWPNLRESDFDIMGKEKGTGFNINVPWNKVGMKNSDYLSVFCHVLLPIAYEFCPDLVLVCAGFDSGIGDPEGHMSATPDIFAHLTHLLMNLAGGRLCAVLEVRPATGSSRRFSSPSAGKQVHGVDVFSGRIQPDVPPAVGVSDRSDVTGRSGPSSCEPRCPLSQVCFLFLLFFLNHSHHLSASHFFVSSSALESLHCVRSAHRPYWSCLKHAAELPSFEISTKRVKDEEKESKQTNEEVMWPEPQIRVAPPVCTAVVLPDGVACPDGCKAFTPLDDSDPAVVCNLREKFLPDGVDGVAMATLSSLVVLVEKMQKNQIRNGLALVPDVAMAMMCVTQHTAAVLNKRVLVVCVGGSRLPGPITEDGKTLLVQVSWEEAGEQQGRAFVPVCLKKGCSDVSGFMQAVLGLLLPLGYQYDPDLVLLMRMEGSRVCEGAWLQLTGLLQGVAQGRTLVLMQDREKDCVAPTVSPLLGDAAPPLGPLDAPLAEDVEALERLRNRLQVDWKLLQTTATETRGGEQH